VRTNRANSPKLQCQSSAEIVFIPRLPRPHWTSEDDKARKKRRTPESFASIRIAELDRDFADRYRGMLLPDDDAGRDDVLLMLHHLARTNNPERRVANWLRLHAPWFDDREAIARILANPHRFRADPLAAKIGLTAERRTRLKITTIGAIDLPKRERNKLRKAKKIEQRREKRRKDGAKPRAEYEAQSIEKAKPWQALGISRRKWFNRQKAERSQNQNIICTSVTPSNLYISTGVRLVQQARTAITASSSG
jgi:hypothetical protein